MWAFGDYVVDPPRFQVRCRGVTVHVEPQVFDVLCHLIAHRDQVVPKENLLDGIWGDRFVSESALTTRIKGARRALGDNGESQRWIRTVRGRGYQFIGDVREVASDGPVPGQRDSPGEQIRFCRGADGVRIAFSCSGSGPALLKAANWMTHLTNDASSPVWRHWLTEFAAQHTLVRYDERGCGLSDWDVGAFTFDDWVTDLETVADAAGLQRFPLVGLSQGAAVAIVFAARFPERVSHLILVDGYLVGRMARARNEEERAAAALDVELARLGWGRSDPAFRRVFAMQFYPDGPPDLWDAFDHLQRSTTSTENAVRFLCEFGRVDVRDQAPAVSAPTLILHSRDEVRVPFACAEEIHQLIPGSRVVPVPSRNHLLTQSEPGWQVLLEEMRRFLDE